jgi:membrane-associated phospholipid phosphatase
VLIASNLFNRRNSFGVYRQLYLVPFIFLVYNNVKSIIDVLFSSDFDQYLIEIDNFIFGTQPAILLEPIINPILTEYLQISYFLFFFMPIIHLIELAKKEDKQLLNKLTRNIIFGFYFSYLLYLFIPAIGPRFTVFDFNAINLELQGIFITEYLREIINIGGGIPLNSINPMVDVNRDCMPSGHTMMTIINIYYAYKFQSKLRYFFYIIGFSLIFATIYLRYHYFIDIIAGLLFAYLSIIFENKFHKIIKENG